MTPELITEPTVFVMGKTEFDRNGLVNWMAHNNLDMHMLDDAETPLANLWRDVDDDFALERMAEFGGRHCYRAWEKGRSRADYIHNILDMEHGSVLEHSSINFACQGMSRTCSHEMVRHRVGVAISQESQRYVSAADMKFVAPPILVWLHNQFPNEEFLVDFIDECLAARDKYVDLQELIASSLGKIEPTTKSRTMQIKRANESARALLPNAAETRMLWTPNVRLLRHFLWLRGGSGADLEIRRLAVELLMHAQRVAPSMFDDMTEGPGDYGVPTIVSAKA